MRVSCLRGLGQAVSQREQGDLRPIAANDGSRRRLISVSIYFRKDAQYVFNGSMYVFLYRAAGHLDLIWQIIQLERTLTSRFIQV